MDHLQILEQPVLPMRGVHLVAPSEAPPPVTELVCNVIGVNGLRVEWSDEAAYSEFAKCSSRDIALVDLAEHDHLVVAEIWFHLSTDGEYMTCVNPLVLQPDAHPSAPRCTWRVCQDPTLIPTEDIKETLNHRRDADIVTIIPPPIAI